MTARTRQKAERVHSCCAEPLHSVHVRDPQGQRGRCHLLRHVYRTRLGGCVHSEGAGHISRERPPLVRLCIHAD
jgi:hypothetical protein